MASGSGPNLGLNFGINCNTHIGGECSWLSSAESVTLLTKAFSLMINMYQNIASGANTDTTKKQPK